MKTYTGCLLFSWCYFFIAIYIAPLIDGNLCVYAACLILCVLNILLFAPIPSANRIMPSGISKRQIKLKAIAICGLWLAVITLIPSWGQYIISGILMLQFETYISVALKKLLHPNKAISDII